MAAEHFDPLADATFPIDFALRHLQAQWMWVRHLDTLMTALLALYGVLAAVILRSHANTSSPAWLLLLLFASSVLLLIGMFGLPGLGGFWPFWPVHSERWWKTVVFQVNTDDRARERFLFGKPAEERGLVGTMMDNDRVLRQERLVVIASLCLFVASWLVLALSTVAIPW